MASHISHSSSSSNSRDTHIASLLTQADALLRKNLAYQRRDIKQNASLVLFPAFLCLLIISIQHIVNSELDNSKYQCGCKCVSPNGTSDCHNICGFEFSTSKQAPACQIRRPREWPALLQVPGPQYRAVKTRKHRFQSLPDSDCLKTLSCPVTTLYTAENKSTAEGLVRTIIASTFPVTKEDLSDIVSLSYLGTNSWPGSNNFAESAFVTVSPILVLLPLCLVNFSFLVPVTLGSATFQHEINCVESKYLWRDNSSIINRELFQGYRKGNSYNEIHEILGAFDFLNSGEGNLNVSLWYNSTYRNMGHSPRLLRVTRSLNMVSNAFLRHFKDRDTRIILDFVKEMPKSGNRIAINLSTILGPLLFSWVIQLLFPVFLISLVYEKQHKLRIMMKIHGLSDRAYWMVTYTYFLAVSSLYMVWFAAIGSTIGLDIFLLNSYGIQFVFYLLYINLQISLAFLAATGFSEVKIASVVAYIYVFGSGLLGAYLFQYYIEDTTLPRWQLLTMDLMPGFSLYKGLYEFSQCALAGHNTESSGMTWKDLNNTNNGMKDTLLIMALECPILICISYNMDKICHLSNKVFKQWKCFWKKRTQPFTMSNRIQSSTVFFDSENSEVHNERCRVEQLIQDINKDHPFVCNNLGKRYMGKDGRLKKQALQSLYLAIQSGECFGMLGPSGSGKSTFINMVTGLLQPTSGNAFVNSIDTRSNTNQIYTSIGMCPQKDVLWESLTGREHLLFYGRLRKLAGTKLQQAVDESLRSLNLYDGNVADRLAGKYSGGMKRRLSVAISLIGDTQVVFLDEPTTGLDPESRNHLWKVINLAKATRAIILTTHSMDEAEFLCDRLGIIVDGRLQCLGSAKELKSRYGKSYQLTMSADPAFEKDVERMVNNISPDVVKTYEVSGTQKFQIPKRDVRISDILEAIKYIKQEIHIYAFGLSDTSLEDVFIDVVGEALKFKLLTEPI